MNIEYTTVALRYLSAGPTSFLHMLVSASHFRHQSYPITSCRTKHCSCCNPVAGKDS